MVFADLNLAKGHLFRLLLFSSLSSIIYHSLYTRKAGGALALASWRCKIDWTISTSLCFASSQFSMPAFSTPFAFLPSLFFLGSFKTTPSHVSIRQSFVLFIHPIGPMSTTA